MSLKGVLNAGEKDELRYKSPKGILHLQVELKEGEIVNLFQIRKGKMLNPKVSSPELAELKRCLLSLSWLAERLI